MATFSGKTIILGAPKHYNLDGVIEKELSDLGFEVINISFHNNQYKYRNVFERIECFFMKNVLWQRQYKTKIAFRENKNWIKKKLEAFDKADYALIIRPDVYPPQFIKKLKNKTNKLIAYQWDGLNRFPQVRKYIKLFDSFFVFNGKDLNEPFVLPITNYYPNLVGKKLEDEKLSSDVFYSGYLINNRLESLRNIIKDCKTLGKNVTLHLFHRSKTEKEEDNLGFKITNLQLDYEQNIRHTYNTKTILDIVSPEHEGLSFRVFEAIGFEKKLITTNPKVKHYDFYNPNNILVWDNTPIAELEDFFNKPYVCLPQEIKNKYGFRNWIQYALNVGDYTPINLPI